MLTDLIVGSKGIKTRGLRRFVSMLALVIMVITFISGTIGVDAAKAVTYGPTFASSASAVLLDGNTVSFTAVFPSVAPSDDGLLYLYQLATYEYAIGANAPIAQAANSTQPTFTFALNHKQADTRLYSKFVVASRINGVMTMLCQPQYITNPELLATHTHPRKANAKKGLQGVDFMNLHMNQTTQISPANLPRVAQVINNGADQAMTNPYSRAGIIPTDPHPGIASYYMLNANDAQGVSLLASKMEYYAANAGATDDWIIGNEVNVRQWNYMIFVSWDEYMRQYEQAFRVCYTAIKSNNANAEVFFCLDQNWDRNRPASHSEYYEYMDGKDFVDRFAADISATGNISWGLAQHPYTVPLTYAKFWDMSGCPDGGYMANMINSNKMVSFQNLTTITNYMATNPALLSPAGTVRPILLSEVGIANGQGDQVQAAALCASYVAASTNPYVEQIIYLNANHGNFDTTLLPMAQDMYNNMDGPNAQAYMNQALQTMGVTSFSQVIH